MTEPSRFLAGLPESLIEPWSLVEEPTSPASVPVLPASAPPALPGPGDSP